MAGIIDDLKRTFKQGNIVSRLIFINVAAFVLGALLSVVLGLFKVKGRLLEALFKLRLFVNIKNTYNLFHNTP